MVEKPALGHVPGEWIVEKEATETEDGCRFAFAGFLSCVENIKTAPQGGTVFRFFGAGSGNGQMVPHTDFALFAPFMYRIDSKSSRCVQV